MSKTEIYRKSRNIFNLKNKKLKTLVKDKPLKTIVFRVKSENQRIQKLLCINLVICGKYWAKSHELHIVMFYIK